MRSAGKKKRSKKAAALEVDSIFAALEDGEAPSGDWEAALHSAASNGSLTLAAAQERAAASPGASEAAPPAAAAPAEPAARQGRKGMAAKAVGIVDDPDALLAKIESPAAAGKKTFKQVGCGAGVRFPATTMCRKKCSWSLQEGALGVLSSATVSGFRALRRMRQRSQGRW